MPRAPAASEHSASVGWQHARTTSVRHIKIEDILPDANKNDIISRAHLRLSCWKVLRRTHYYPTLLEYYTNWTSSTSAIDEQVIFNNWLLQQHEPEGTNYTHNIWRRAPVTPTHLHRPSLAMPSIQRTYLISEPYNFAKLIYMYMYYILVMSWVYDLSAILMSILTIT